MGRKNRVEEASDPTADAIKIIELKMNELENI